MPTITSTIVSVNATVVTAPVPSGLQQSGAIVSVGGTTITEGTYQYFGTLAALEAVLSTEGNYLEVGYMAETFFAQQGQGQQSVGVYVLELGIEGSAPAGITALQTWINANPNVFYAYLTPATWDASGAAFNTMAANYSSPTGKTYFFATTTSGTISAYAPTTKAIFAVVPSPTAAASEFQAAAFFYAWLSNNPGPANPAAPMSFRYVYGVTPWVLTNNQSTITTILSAYGNVILTGAEGGISTATIRDGTMMDGNQAMAWYAVDWLLINFKQQVAAGTINGSNTTSPLYYNQQGINFLLSVLSNICKTGISYGLLLSAVPDAVSFAVYKKENPSDYAAGKYNGFSVDVVTQNGFLTLTVYLTVSQFATT